MKPIVLIIEGRSGEAEPLVSSLRVQALGSVQASTPEDAPAYLERPVDLVLSGLSPVTEEGRRALEMWRLRRPDTPFVVYGVGGCDEPNVAERLGATGCVRLTDDGRAPAGFATQLETWLKTDLNSLGNGDKVDTSESTSANEADRDTGIHIPPGTTLEDLERAAVEQALREHQGNRTHAAKSLGISVRTLQRKLKAWHGSNNTGNSSSSESRMNMTKLRPVNAWNTPNQGMSHPLNIRSQAARA